MLMKAKVKLSPVFSKVNATTIKNENKKKR